MDHCIQPVLNFHEDPRATDIFEQYHSTKIPYIPELRESYDMGTPGGGSRRRLEPVGRSPIDYATHPAGSRTHRAAAML